MTDDESSVPIVCDECGTTAQIPLSDLADQLEAHNERMHDGEPVAEVDPDVADQLADLVADELGLLDG
ncbi:hypothetical protein [Halorhabdus salina]|uniref:hypothetical protein n=1 Tax=Halorhabdus salina TaxID=2750670 RepID=UPI0015EE6423|nr:hypothetical protein [Halorhabdus salina]